jgi:hypothetical protein
MGNDKQNMSAFTNLKLLERKCCRYKKIWRMKKINELFSKPNWALCVTKNEDPLVYIAFAAKPSGLLAFIFNIPMKAMK